jgi:hypothetical protein
MVADVHIHPYSFLQNENWRWSTSGEPWYSGRIGSSFSTSGARCITLCQHPLIRHERWKEKENVTDKRNISVVLCNISVVLCNISVVLCNISVVLCNISVVLCNIFVVLCNISVVLYNISVVLCKQWFFNSYIRLRSLSSLCDDIKIVKVMNSLRCLILHNKSGSRESEK